jgi:hypothetical protein
LGYVHVGIDEGEVVAALDGRQGLERVALDELDAVGDAGPLPEPARLRDPLGIALERDDHPVARERLGHVQRRVPDGGADLEHARGSEGGDEHREQPPGLPVDDRDVIALGEGLHLGHDLRPLARERSQVGLDVVRGDHRPISLSRAYDHLGPGGGTGETRSA